MWQTGVKAEPLQGQENQQAAIILEEKFPGELQLDDQRRQNKQSETNIQSDITEIIIDQSEVTMIKYLPTCPKCKLTEDVIFSNVSSKIYQCLRCNLKFRFSDSCPVNTKK